MDTGLTFSYLLGWSVLISDKAIVGTSARATTLMSY